MSTISHRFSARAVWAKAVHFARIRGWRMVSKARRCFSSRKTAARNPGRSSAPSGEKIVSPKCRAISSRAPASPAMTAAASRSASNSPAPSLGCNSREKAVLPVATPPVIPRIGTSCPARCCLFLEQGRFQPSRSGGCLRRERLDDFFLLLIANLDRLAGGVDQAGRDEDDEVDFDVLIRRGAEEPAENRQVAEERNLVIHFLDVLAHEAAEHDGRAIPDGDAGRDLACAEDGLVDDVLGQHHRSVGGACGRGNRAAQAEQGGVDGGDGAAVVDEALKLDHLRNKG